ncbi:hypothetical protein AAX59_06175 [Francisella tularensis subsp. holarctica]|nr:hypothetical protein AAX59_06175 [Francisella tularensis subsp. holarctica]
MFLKIRYKLLRLVFQVLDVTDKLLIQEYIKNGFLYVPPQQSCSTGKSYYLLAKDSETENFDKIKGLLTSYFK